MVPEIRIEAFVLFFIDHELLGLCIVNPPNGRRCARSKTALPEHSPVLSARVFQGAVTGARLAGHGGRRRTGRKLARALST